MGRWKVPVELPRSQQGVSARCMKRWSPKRMYVSRSKAVDPRGQHHSTVVPQEPHLTQQPSQLVRIKLAWALAESIPRVHLDHIGKPHVLDGLVQDQDRNTLSVTALVQRGAE